MAIEFQDTKLKAKYQEKLKERRQLLNKHGQTDSIKEKVEINKKIERLDLEIEEIKKQGAATTENLLKALMKMIKF